MNLQAVQEESMKKKKKTRIVFCTYLIVLHCSYSTCQRSNRNVWLTAKSTTVTFFYVIQFCSKFCKKSTYQWSLALRVKMYCNTLCSCSWKNKLILLSFLILCTENFGHALESQPPQIVSNVNIRYCTVHTCVMCFTYNFG